MLATTHTSSVTEEQIDHLGHMNVVFYGVNAHAGTRAMVGAIDGWPSGSYLVHDTYTRHHQEQMRGTSLVVRSGLLGVDADGVRIHHELLNADSDGLAATFVHRVSPLDERGRRRSLPDQCVETARHSTIDPLPYAAARSIDLDLEPLASAPPLGLVRERRLEVRQPRRIGAQECDAHGRYRPDSTMMLLWGGEVPDHLQDWGADLYEGPGGELMGWAIMETRIQLGRLPLSGDHIQSFAATMALHDKASHRLHWCYDLATEEVLCAFEAVDVAFDTRVRRAMTIPAAFRRRQESRLYPDLAPR